MTKPLIPINPGGLDDLAESLLEPIQSDSDAEVIVSSTGQNVTLRNIICKDANGTEFERYNTLSVAKDIARNADKTQINNSPYQWAVFFEGQEMFLPSFALSCNIVAALYKNRTDPAVAAVLQHYKDKGNGGGYHGQNTLINFSTSEVIHYPTRTDFSQPNEVNAPRTRTALPFLKTTLQDALLVDALRDSGSVNYVRQLTGLVDPAILVEVGNYFGKPAKLWFPWTGQRGAEFNETRAAWLGCNSNSFYLSAYSNLGNTNAARGVRLGAP